MNIDPKPTFMENEHGRHILRDNGTYSSYRDMLRLADGRVHITLTTGDTMTTTEAEAREITGWTGLIFTAEERQAQADYDAARPAHRFVDGALECDPHPAYTPYLAALQAGDVAGAVAAAVAVDTARGYVGTAEFWADAEAAILRFTQSVETKSGRVFMPGDLALARRDARGHYTALSARSGHNVLVLEGQYEIVQH